MGAGDESLQLERERRDADARYNAALTALDHVVAECRGRPVDADACARLSHALIIFLQQITAFVDTKDRALSADISARVGRVEGMLSDIAELRTRIGLLQRATRTATVVSHPSPGVSQPPVVTTPSDLVYVGFEDQFRGSDESVAAKVRAYVSIFVGATDVVDLGCGRGEFLAALRDAGIRARGVDANAEMAAVARERGLDVEHGDALGFVDALPDESIGGAVATQVVEHLEPAYLLRLLDALARKLRPGSPIVLETINAACWLAFFSSYIRDFTHVRPMHPDTLQYLLRANGFERVEIRYSAPVPEPMKLHTIDVPAEILSSTEPAAAALMTVAHTINANAAILNSLLFTYLDYAAVGYRA
jgi:SAM-dependent methyltransferase